MSFISTNLWFNSESDPFAHGHEYILAAFADDVLLFLTKPHIILANLLCDF